MSKRNLRKIAVERADNVNELYDLRAGDLIELHDIVREKGAVMGITVSFLVGYEMGVRATKAEQKNKKPCGCANTQQGSH